MHGMSNLKVMRTVYASPGSSCGSVPGANPPHITPDPSSVQEQESTLVRASETQEQIALSSHVAMIC